MYCETQMEGEQIQWLARRLIPIIWVANSRPLATPKCGKQEVWAKSRAAQKTGKKRTLSLRSDEIKQRNLELPYKHSITKEISNDFSQPKAGKCNCHSMKRHNFKPDLKMTVLQLIFKKFLKFKNVKIFKCLVTKKCRKQEVRANSRAALKKKKRK